MPHSSNPFETHSAAELGLCWTLQKIEVRVKAQKFGKIEKNWKLFDF